MSDRKTKAREKRNAKRATKQKTRRVRNQRAAETANLKLDTLLSWQMGEAWLGQSWHEQGSRIPAVISRVHPAHGIAIAIFDLDLRSRGVVHAGILTGLTENELNARLAELSETAPMVQIGPAHVLACVEAAQGLNDELPDGFDDARKLFGDLETDGSIEVLTGEPPEPPKRKGLFARLFP